MKRRFGLLTVTLSLSFGALLLAWVLALAADRKPADADRDFFGLTKVHPFHLQFTAEEWQAIQPATGGGFFGFGGAGGQPPQTPADKGSGPKRETHRGGSFNIEYPWVHGDLAADGKSYTDVGVRYKGGGSYVVSAGRLKRNLKVDLDRYNEGQRLQDRKTVNLNAGAMDTTKWREALGYVVYRAAGVPAPRTAFAEVTLTVPGKYDKELLGLYTVVEPIDKVFLKNHFKNGDGLLLKPERVRLLEYLGDDWSKYKDRYNPKREATRAESQRIIAFSKLVNQADDERFRKEIGSYLDLDAFLRFLGVTAMLANLDNTFFGGHNVYLYLDPATNKFAFIPWDLDLAFGGFFLFGSPDQQADLSLTHPYPGENKLVDRLLAIKDISDKYQQVLKELAPKCFAEERLVKDVDAVDRATRDILGRETKAATARKESSGFGFGPPGGGNAAETPDLRKFIAKRSESITAQLEGRRKGTIPAMGFGNGPGGRPGGFGALSQPGKILTAPVQNQLKLTAEQKRELEAIQKEVDARLEKLLTVDQRNQLKEMQRGPRPGGGRPGGPGGPPPRPE